MRVKRAGLYSNSLNRRKNEIHLKTTLKSGKVAHLWLYRRYYPNLGEPYNAWHTGFCIAETDKEARLWYRGKHRGPSGITGDGSIEGLSWASRNLEEIVKELPANDCVTVEWEDNRRASAYSILLRRGWSRGYRCYYKNGERC